jgi:hypothetical protein
VKRRLEPQATGQPRIAKVWSGSNLRYNGTKRLCWLLT